MASHIYSFADSACVLDPFHPYPRVSSHSLPGASLPIVIDNGSYQCRAGWTKDPHPLLVFKNQLCKQRGKKDWEAQVGNDIPNLDAVRWLLKSPFERNVVTQMETQEQILDHVFSRLSIDSQNEVCHAVVMTEALGNPNISRQQMNELLFEGYRVPSVAWGVDALFSFHFDQPRIADGLILSLGCHTATVIPVLDGQACTLQVQRINIGGTDLINSIQKLLQLKYPLLQTHISLGRAEEICHEHCHVSKDYLEELRLWADDDYYETNVHRMQLPSVPTAAASAKDVEAARQKREQQAQRMREMAAKRKKDDKKKKTENHSKVTGEMEKEKEKLSAEKARSRHLMSVKEMDPSGGVTGNEEAFEIAMASLGFTTTDQLDSAIGKLNSKISKLKESVKSLKASIAASPGVDSVDSETAKGAFDLLEVPDEQLTEGQIAAKKKQNMLFRLHQGRQRAKELREKKKEIDTQETKRLEEKRKTDFKGWLNEMRKKRQDLLTSKAKRHRRRTEMAKRHTLASQQRMKIITELARGGSGSARKMKDDSFGARDEDWDVYKQINLEGGDSESEEEGERLDQVEQTLREHDPGFGEVGVSGTGFSTAENHQLHIGLERIRIPEILFQPSLIGHDQMGLAECVEATLKGFTDDQQRRLAENIFLTGGLSKYPGLVERLDAEVMMMRPFGSSFSVTMATDPVVNAWRGAQKWASDNENIRMFSITKEDFSEKGSDYLKEHSLSNRHVQFYTANLGSQIPLTNS